MNNKILLVALAVGIFVSCHSQKVVDPGTYTGYSWKGEAKGISFDESSERIETKLSLATDGTIKEASIQFLKNIDGQWRARQESEATVSVDFDIDPMPAIPGGNYRAGVSQFSVDTMDMMSFYAAAVAPDGRAALLVVEPVTRYQFEVKFTTGYNYDTAIGEITIGSGLLVPTARVSSSGLLKPDNWSDLAEKSLFNIHYFSHVLVDDGVFKGLNEGSSVEELLTAIGISFKEGVPQPSDALYGFSSKGGWAGNYKAIETFLVGKNVTKGTSLINWSVEKWAGGINEENQFGIDIASGATKTAQNSFDTIAGATVRMSRESTSYQRALVAAGVIDESDVVVGRF